MRKYVDKIWLLLLGYDIHSAELMTSAYRDRTSTSAEKRYWGGQSKAGSVQSIHGIFRDRANKNKTKTGPLSIPVALPNVLTSFLR